MDDDALFARFAALRAPTGSVESTLPRSGATPSTTTTAVEDKARATAEEDAEVQRWASGPLDSEHREDDLAALLAGLSKEPKFDSGDAGEHDNKSGVAAHDSEAGLERQAADLLKQAGRLPSTGPSRESETEADDVSGDEGEESEEQVLERLLAEAALEASAGEGTEGSRVSTPTRQNNQVSSPSPDRLASTPVTEPVETDGFPQFPSTTALPVPLLDADGEEDDPADKARIEALMKLGGPSLFPSVPTTAPTKKGELGPPPRAPGQGWNIPGFNDARDEDLDSWCSTSSRSVGGRKLTSGICNKDAQVKCLGCEGDLYCRECWDEGHGPGPGKEKGHKALKFTWTR